MFTKDYEVFGFLKQNPSITPSAAVLDKMAKLYHSGSNNCHHYFQSPLQILKAPHLYKEGKKRKEGRKTKEKRKKGKGHLWWLYRHIREHMHTYIFNYNFCETTLVHESLDCSHRKHLQCPFLCSWRTPVPLAVHMVPTLERGPSDLSLH